jgi:cysteine desulfurase
VSDPVYLDHNATTPLLPEVVDGMLPYLREHFGNPSSGHVYGQRARAAVERARAQVAALLGARADEVTFTSGGTEANNLAILGAAFARPERRTIVTSAIEHPATFAACAELERRGLTVLRLPVDPRGQVQVPAARAALANAAQVALVTVLHAHNETGVLQPIAELSHLARAGGAWVHTDAAQSLGKVSVDVNSLGVDLLSVVGHKLYGPKGVGALYVRRGTALVAQSFGAGQEKGLRPGTENVAAVVGLGVACEVARREQAAQEQRMGSLAMRLWDRLAARVPGLALTGHVKARLPNTLFVRFPKVTGAALLAACAADVAAGTGSACHEGAVAFPAVCLAMGLSAEEAKGSVRLTLGRLNTEADIDRAAEALASAWDTLAA